MIRHQVSGISTLMVATLLVACGGGPAESPSDSGSAVQPPADRQLPAAAAAAAGARGSATLRGTIVYEGEVPALRPLAMDADPGCAKKHSEPVLPEVLVLGDDKTMANVFVRVKGGLSGGSYPAPAEPVVLDQRGCRYLPHVSGVLVGQTFRILNSDGLLHNVHGLPDINSGFNRAMPATVTQADYVFDKEEFMFKIKCDVHPWMNAWVAVMTHPFFDVTGRDGGYELTGLPAGSYEIEAWHERLGSQTASLTVGEGETTERDFTFSR